MVHHGFRVHPMLGLTFNVPTSGWTRKPMVGFASPKLTLNRKITSKSVKNHLPNNSGFEFRPFIFRCVSVSTYHFVWAYFPWLVFSLGKETGPLELYFFFGPSVKDVLRQYHDLTGLPRMVPLAALGKHQSRWNYITPQDVMEVGVGWIRDFTDFLVKGKKGGIEKRVPEGGGLLTEIKGWWFETR